MKKSIVFLAFITLIILAVICVVFYIILFSKSYTLYQSKLLKNGYILDGLIITRDVSGLSKSNALTGAEGLFLTLLPLCWAIVMPQKKWATALLFLMMPFTTFFGAAFLGESIDVFNPAYPDTGVGGLAAFPITFLFQFFGSLIIIIACKPIMSKLNKDNITHNV